MPLWRVPLQDGRTVAVYAPTPAEAVRHVHRVATEAPIPGRMPWALPAGVDHVTCQKPDGTDASDAEG